MENPTGTHHAVYVPIEDAGVTEHVWLTHVAYGNGRFEGTINNRPTYVGNVKMGQKCTVEKAEIRDWLFVRDGKIYGHYTFRPLLKRIPQEEAERWRPRLAEP